MYILSERHGAAIPKVPHVPYVTRSSIFSDGKTFKLVPETRLIQVEPTGSL